MRLKQLTACAGSLMAVLSASGSKPLPPLVRDGDIIFHTSHSSQSEAVQRATGSPYSHMGLVFRRDGSPCVLEAVATVRCTPLARWVAGGSGGHFVLKRLKDPATLEPNAISALRAEA